MIHALSAGQHVIPLISGPRAAVSLVCWKGSLQADMLPYGIQVVQQTAVTRRLALASKLQLGSARFKLHMCNVTLFIWI